MRVHLLRPGWVRLGFGLLFVAFEAVGADDQATRGVAGDQEIQRRRFIADVRLAHAGEREAQFAVGSTYLHLGDHAAARTWWARAAEAGSAKAAIGLGWMHERGLGVAPSDELAAIWYRRAADAGEPRGLADLGRIMRRRPGQAAVAEAHDLFVRAAAAGDAVGQHQLGLLYADGVGVGRDDALAYAWFLRAAEQGYLPAEVAAGICLVRGSGVEADPATGRRWLSRPAAHGDPVANFHLAGLLSAGVGGPGDRRAAFAAYRVAARAGHRAAQVALARALEAEADAESWREAADWYRLAADAGSRTAMNRLGELHSSGRGIAADDALARNLFLKAAELGEPQAMFNAAVMLDEGRGGVRDSDLALRFFSRAAEAGFDDARREIDRILGYDRKVTKERTKGFWQR